MKGKTKLITTGYTGYGLINKNKVSLTSYTLNINRNLINSNGVYNSTKGDVNDVYRNGMPVIQDFPTVDLQIKVQCTKSLFLFFCKMIANQRNKSVQICFVDKSTGFQFVSDYNYLRSMSFSVNQNSILQLDLSFLSISEHLHISNGDFKVFEYVSKELPFTEQQRLMTYWEFYLRDKKSHIPDIIGFDFSFQQDLIPKYGLTKSLTVEAPMCKKIVFGLPKISFGLTRLMNIQRTYNFVELSEQRFVTKEQLQSNAFQICFRDGLYLGMQGVILQSISPRIEQKNQVSLYQQNYNVVGKLYNGNGASDYTEGGGVYPGGEFEPIYPELKEQIININDKTSQNESLYIYSDEIQVQNGQSVYNRLKKLNNIIG